MSLFTALQALFKESQGVMEEFAKLINLDVATVKVWFNNKWQWARDNDGDASNMSSSASNV